MGTRQFEADEPAERMPDDVGRGDAEIVHHPKGVGGHGGDPVALFQRIGRAPGAAMIVADHPKPLGQGWNLRREIAARSAETRREQDRPFPVPVDLVMDGRAHGLPT